MTVDISSHLLLQTHEASALQGGIQQASHQRAEHPVDSFRVHVPLRSWKIKLIIARHRLVYFSRYSFYQRNRYYDAKPVYLLSRAYLNLVSTLHIGIKIYWKWADHMVGSWRCWTYDVHKQNCLDVDYFFHSFLEMFWRSAERTGLGLGPSVLFLTSLQAKTERMEANIYARAGKVPW